MARMDGVGWSRVRGWGGEGVGIISWPAPVYNNAPEHSAGQIDVSENEFLLLLYNFYLVCLVDSRDCGTGRRLTVLLVFMWKHLTLIEEGPKMMCLSAGRLIVDYLKQQQ